MVRLQVSPGRIDGHPRVVAYTGYWGKEVNPVDRRMARSRALHRAIAKKVLADPQTTVAAARQRLARLATDPHARYYVEEWSRWLEAPPADVYGLLAEDDSEYAEALRRMSPFVGLLSAGERRAICQQFQRGGRSDAP